MSSVRIEHIEAGEGVTINLGLPLPADHYLVKRGPSAHQSYLQRPNEPYGDDDSRPIPVSDLRAAFIDDEERLEKPIRRTIRGTLFSCALLASGWWEKHSQAKLKNITWRTEVQAWLFHGFELWGPSWDFTFDLDHWNTSSKRPYFVAQLGDGDEANSIPVLIPQEKAKRIQEYAGNRWQWGGFEAQITGMLGHRAHFSEHLKHRELELFGGLLDYCLWVDESDPQQGIEAMVDERTGIYSGYLWKCVAPKAFLNDKQKPNLRDVFFIWEHTNFASESAVKYNLESLAGKERFLEREYGELALVQKSSMLVPGTPQWSSREVYELLIGKNTQKI